MKDVRKSFITLALMIAVVLAGGRSLAAESASKINIFRSDLVFLANPDGAALEIGLDRKHIWEPKKEGDENPYVLYGMSLGLNPSYTQVAANFQFLPAAFTVIRLQYDYYIFSGNNGSLMSFPSGDSAFGDSELEAKEGEEEYATGHRFMFKPTLRAKAGILLMINEATLAYYKIDGKGPYFRESQYDTLIKDDDLIIDNLTMFPLEIYKKGKDASLYAGPFYEVTYARAADLTRQRTGLVAYWIPSDRLWHMDKPRVYSMLGFNLQDRNRDDEVFFIIGMGFDIVK